HNVDKGQICGGQTNVEFGGGEFLKPIFVLLSGRATSEVNEKRIPAQYVAMKAARDYMKEVCRNLDVDNCVTMDSRISQGSKDLIDVFLRGPKIPFSNDTSFGIGYAPFSEAEQLALETERMLNSKEYKNKMPAVGEDVKVMCLRQKDEIKITVAIAFVSKYVKNLGEYLKIKEEVKKDVEKLAKKITKRTVNVFVNTADNEERGSVYITLTGLSCEQGDDGSVGRGNRVNGLITPGRPMSLEAAAGKNPVNHVGKIYNVLAFEIAKDLVKAYPQIEQCSVSLLAQIGKSIDQPAVAGVEINMKKGESLDAIRGKVNYAVDEWLEEITEVTNMIVEKEVGVY
ncbi:MAG: methionine adenosyltransferase, partial [Candidatus Micrarchaeota archaeon]